MKLITALAVAASTSAYPLFKQCNPEWKNNRLGSAGASTICKVGCAMSSLAMILDDCGVTVGGKRTTPGTLNAWLRKNGGYTSNLLVWSAVNKLGVIYRNKVFSRSEYEKKFQQGYGLIIQVKKRSHWVLMTGIKDAKNFLVHDPGYSTLSYAKSGVSQAALYERPSRCKTRHSKLSSSSFPEADRIANSWEGAWDLEAAAAAVTPEDIEATQAMYAGEAFEEGDLDFIPDFDEEAADDAEASEEIVVEDEEDVEEEEAVERF